MRILYITQTFYPETLAAERGMGQMIQLLGLGHQVTVLTTMPSYPYGRIQDPYRGKLSCCEIIEGLTVVRVWSLPSSTNMVIRRVLSWASFALVSIMKGMLLRRTDLIIAAVPNPGTELAGIILGWLKGSKVLLEMIDLVPENLLFVGISEQSAIYHMLSKYYSLAYRMADIIAVLCPSAADTIVEKGIDRGKIMFLPNAADADILDAKGAEDIRRQNGLEGKFVVAYAGSFSRYYEVSNIIAAARLLKNSHPEIHFMLLGGGAQWEEVKEEINIRPPGNITLVGIVPRSTLAAYLHAADMFLFTMVANPIPRPYHGILTAKVCDYLAVGRPVLAVESGPIVGDLLLSIGAGDRVEAGNPAALAKAIVSYVDDQKKTQQCGMAAAAYAIHNLMRENIIAQFDRELCQMMVSLR